MALLGLILLGLILWVVYSSFSSYRTANEALTRIRDLEDELAALRRTLPNAGFESSKSASEQIRVAQEAVKAAPPPPEAPEPEEDEEPEEPEQAASEPPSPPTLPKEPIYVPREPSGPSNIPKIDWESFTGAKLFAWVGGFALFLGAAFFVKYSIEHGLISPTARIAIGFITGIGCIFAGLRIKQERHLVTAHTLCAAGVAILYAATFAAHAHYSLIPVGVAFPLMILITVASFLLAVRLDSRYIAILGLVGGFLTPPLLSTGVDHPFGLFGYVAILDIGLAMIAIRKRWDFLFALGALGTVGMQIGWTQKFFAVGKLFTGISIFTAFPALFALNFGAKFFFMDDPDSIDTVTCPDGGNIVFKVTRLKEEK